jgi:DNA-binding CsgD family transcriptional regulator
LSEGSGFDPRAAGRPALPRSLAAADGGHLRGLPPDTRSILEMLAVLNLRLPLAQLGQGAEVGSPSAAIEPAVACGLVDWWPDEPTCPVELRHLLVRDAIYAGIPATRRRLLHARAALLVSESASWEHRVAAALYLMLAEESRGLALRPAVEAAGPSPLRGCVLGSMALFSGQFAAAERLFTEALAQARTDPDSGPLAALIASWLAGTYLLLGDGAQGMSFGKWALGTGCLDALAASWTRAQIAIGALEAVGPGAALAELGHLDPDPARAGPLDAECLAFRGAFWMAAGDLGRGVADMTAGLAMVRRGAPLALGLQPYAYLALAQYLAGRWDDALLTCEQAFSAAAIRSRRYELPLLHLAAACVPAGRGAAGEAEQHALRAKEAAASLDSGLEKLYAALARALVCQAAGDYLGLADALGPWLDEEDLDDRNRGFGMFLRPLPAEGLIGSGQTGPAAAVLQLLRENARQVRFLQPALAWLEGWLAEQRGAADLAREIYARGEQAADAQSPVHTARLLLAHGKLLRRTGQRRMAVERLRRAHQLYLTLRAAPFLARTEEELAACHLPADPATNQPVLALTSRETEVAHLVGKGLSNREIAAELLISRKAVEYHLGNIYAKCGMRGRQELRRFVEQWRQPAAVWLPGTAGSAV